jgi:hypothetical protein
MSAVAPGRASELKQQGAIDAARDPNSSVTAEDAERKVVEEARAAGSAAYQFDPNATAEQKAAQIAGVRGPFPCTTLRSGSRVTLFARRLLCLAHAFDDELWLT